MKASLLLALLLPTACSMAQSTLDGPHAPVVTFSSSANPAEIVLQLDNPVNSNNYFESYADIDPTVAPINGLFEFQGYQVFQVIDNTVGYMDRNDAEKARMIGQSDIADGVVDLYNITFDAVSGFCVWTEEVTAHNSGTEYATAFTWDVFENAPLEEGKEYCFLVLPYAYGANFTTPDCPEGAPYLVGKRTVDGAAIAPHCTTYGASTSIHELNRQQTMRLLPNPAADRVQIELEGNAAEQLSVFDLTGRTVLQTTANAVNTLDVSSWEPGIYLVQASNAQQLVAHQKLVVH